jgi:molybdopterin/thiamine biosynthesis adenylyltransferase
MMNRRYQKQIILPELGLLGQEKLKNTGVLIIGAGGLGTPVATYLTALGIGKIGIVDYDIIQQTNLHRQFSYTESDLNNKKVEILTANLKRQNPSIQIHSYPQKIDSITHEEIISTYTIVCDCTDNVESRVLIDEMCSTLSIPLVFASVQGWQGYVTILNHKQKIRLTDIFSIQTLIQNSSNNCEENGVMPTTCGIIGSYQANEVVKIALGISSNLDGAIFCIDTFCHKNRILSLKNH